MILLVISCAPYFSQAGVPEESEKRSAQYDALYPLYAEWCGHSQIRMLPPGFGETVVGGEWGHSTIYIKGMCRDMSQGYPLLKPCDEMPRADHDGVGVSADYDYQNVNWIAVPERHFFYWGDLKPGERFSRETYLRTLARAKAMRLLDGTRMWDKFLAKRPPGVAAEEFFWEDVFGTDFAVNVGRASSCVRVPITRPELDQVAAELNAVNQYAHAHQNPFNDISNNCEHTSHNALAATGFDAAVAVNQPTPLDLADVVLSFNEIVKLMKRGNEKPLGDVWAMSMDASARKWLVTQGRIPTQHGVLVESWPAYQPNDVYDVATAPKFLEIPLIDNVSRAFERITHEPSETDVEANLLSFQARYLEVQKNRPSSLAMQNDADAGFTRKYYAWIDAQVVDVKEKLAKLSSLPR